MAEIEQLDETTTLPDVSARKALARLWPLIRQHKGWLALSLGLLVVSTAVSLWWPIILKNAIDGPIASKAIGTLVWVALGVLGLQGMAFLTQYLQRITLERIGQDVMLSLKSQLFRHLLTLDISYFDKHPVGRLIARVESDAESIRMLFTNTVVLVVGDLLLLTGIYAIMAFENWRMAATLFLSIPAMIAMTYLFHRLTSHRFLGIRKKMAEVVGSLSEFLHGMSIVQIFHRTEFARQQLNKANKKKFSDDRYVHVGTTLFFNVIMLFEYIKIGLLLLLGSRWELTTGQMVLFLVYIWRSFEPIFRTSEQLSTFQKGIAGAKRIEDLLTTQPRIGDPLTPANWGGLTTGIQFDDVSFSYTDDENYALLDATFDIPKGKRVALVGVTGGGKSTVISLLFRMYDPQKGKITVDGTDIRMLDRDNLRKRFSLVLQDIVLFPGTVAENIGLNAPDISREKIIQAAQVVEADRFIARLPKGYDTPISEKGSNFSRGERQLLSFARALAFDPEVLILDEATSSVDPETERTIQGSLKKLMKGRTSLIIAHRLSTILDVDQILVIRQGKIIERGTHTELILQDGYYSRLFHLQFKHLAEGAKNA